MRKKYGFPLIFVCFYCFIIHSQGKSLQDEKPIRYDSIPLIDTLRSAVDSLAVKADSSALPPPSKSDVSTTINYSARDSINFSVDTKIVKLYGDAKIEYGTIQLEADHITIDYSNNTLTAIGRKDSLGRKVGYPIFKNGAEVYETKKIRYNFKTKRAQISEVVTKQGEGFLHGETVYKNSKDELFSIENTYTTCNLEHPHFRIRSKRTKAIPNNKIVSGPFYLEINDVPTPLGFAFGMFPAKQEASSGLIIPSYGEENRRGFYLRGGGYFFDISDYIKATLTGDVYSKGGHGINLTANYKKKYAYTGNFTFNYTKLRVSSNIEDESSQNDYRIAWTFTPQSKRNSRFSASVNAATSTYNQNNFLGINEEIGSTGINNLTRKLSSNVSYSKTFQGTPFSLGLSMRHNQDVSTREVDLLLPSLTFNMSNIYPFRGKSGTSSSWVSKLSLRYSMTGTNNITNNLGRIGVNPAQDSIAPFSVDNFGTFLKNGRKGMRHSIPLSTSLRLLKHFTLSPSVSYDERWYFEQLVWGLDPENQNNTIVTDTLSGFNRVYDYSMSAGISTRIYGTYFFKKGSIKAIRHVMNPSISFSYRPDFSTEKFGYYQRLENESGNEILRSKYQGFAYGTPSAGESGSIGFSLSNTLEMKVKSKKDTSDVARKVPILNNFGFSTSYNLVADSFKLSSISLRANSSIFNKKVSINTNATIDPYTYVLDSVGFNRLDEPIYHQHRIDRYAWNNGNGIGQITSASVGLSTNLNPKGQKQDEDTREKINDSNLTEEDKNYLLNNPDTYVDFNIPWSIRLNYNLNYRKTGFEKATITQSLRFSGDLSLSEKWKVTFNSGYDIEEKEFSITTLGLSRDLHCWEMNLSWTPFGVYTSYNFTIRVKSSLLQDLKLNRTRSFYDR